MLLPGRDAAVLSDLLPDSFGPADLGVEGALLAHAEWRVALDSTTDELAAAACSAAQRSYAPYTKSPSGVALRLTDGDIVSAPYIENGAFNPSLSPLLSAVNLLRFRAKSTADVKEVCLVEAPRAKISQQRFAAALCEASMPTARFRVSYIEVR